MQICNLIGALKFESSDHSEHETLRMCGRVWARGLCSTVAQVRENVLFINGCNIACNGITGDGVGIKMSLDIIYYTVLTTITRNEKAPPPTLISLPS